MRWQELGRKFIEQKRRSQKKSRAGDARAQFSVEHLTTVAIAMVVLVPVIFIFYTYSQKSTQDLVYAQVENIAQGILGNAESIYYLGEPNKVTLDVNMPSGITQLNLQSDPIQNVYELEFIVHDRPIVFSSEVPINGTFDESSISYGKKSIQITSLGNVVNISIR